VEYHLDLQCWRPVNGALPTDCLVRRYHSSDEPVVSELHAAVAYRTVRRAGEAKQLYDMPGTAGWVLVDSTQVIQAYLFCGKGADFPLYGLEWGGDPTAVSLLLAQVRHHGGVRWLLAPQGTEPVRELLLQQGAGCRALPSGLWKVIHADSLSRELAIAKVEKPRGDVWDARTWLGDVGPDGTVQAGRCRMAVWGFDSV